ncbi:MAG TPA: hypothetical protein VG873_16055 [Burkholderiales bacterium]|jgi:hypothetical protein|nr:hypothetical protein [Burkholderiales bacterium]
MEWPAITAGWSYLYKGNFQRRFHKLTRAQVEATEGRREALVTLVQAGYGVPAEKAEAQVADWQSRQRVLRMLIDQPW